MEKNGKEVKILSSADCHRFFEEREFAEWSTLDEYVTFSNSVLFVKINELNFKLSVCSCHWSCKYYKCKHLIDLVKRLNYLSYDSKVQSVPIGQNRRRGRPGKTKGALEYQPTDEQFIFSECDSEKDLDLPKPKKGRKKKVINNTDCESSDDFDLLDDRIVASKLLKKNKQIHLVK